MAANFGWINNPMAVRATLATMPRPLFRAAAPHLAGTGAGKQSLLYRAWPDVLGDWFQYPAQQIGDCVSRGYSEGIDLLSCVQIRVDKTKYEFKSTSHEAVYGMARAVGNALAPPGPNSDGAVGAWAAKAVTTIGTVAQELVGPYSDDLAGDWGWHGVPKKFLDVAGEHKVGTASLVQSLAELDDALANGYPVPVCSDQGFTMTRDRNGFCAARGTWNHCMLICGSRTDIPGYCIMQSWGMDQPDGPLALGQPPNSFWASAGAVSRMLSQGDTFVISNFDGYPARVLPDSWSWVDFVS